MQIIRDQRSKGRRRNNSVETAAATALPQFPQTIHALANVSRLRLHEIQSLIRILFALLVPPPPPFTTPSLYGSSIHASACVACLGFVDIHVERRQWYTYKPAETQR